LARAAIEEEAARRAEAEAEAAREAEDAAAQASAEAAATLEAAARDVERAAAEAQARADADAAAKAEAERRAADPLWHLTPQARKLVDRSSEQLSRTTDPATVAQLVRGYEARLSTANAELKPAIEAMLGNAKGRLEVLRATPADSPR